MIHIENIKKSYGAGQHVVHALDDVSIDVAHGDFLSIIGQSGSGKTTLLNTMGGLDQNYSGSVVIDNKNIKELSDAKLSQFRNQTIGFVFQNFSLLPHLTCGENVALPAFFDRQRKNRNLKQEIESALLKVGLSKEEIGRDIINAPASDLSGGQKQRLAIARSLFNDPKILLCDEPTGNLDTNTGKIILELFQSLNEQEALTIVLITHELHIAQYSNKSVTMQDGRLIVSPEQPVGVNT